MGCVGEWEGEGIVKGTQEFWFARDYDYSKMSIEEYVYHCDDR
jgi:hypothetical protein